MASSFLSRFGIPHIYSVIPNHYLPEPSPPLMPSKVIIIVIINSPGVAGAVLRTPFVLFYAFIKTLMICENIFTNTFTPRP